MDFCFFEMSEGKIFSIGTSIPPSLVSFFSNNAKSYLLTFGILTCASLASFFLKTTSFQLNIEDITGHYNIIYLLALSGYTTCQKMDLKIAKCWTQVFITFSSKLI